jgi:hypothetical protein
MRESVPQVWDLYEHRLQTDNPRETAAFRGRFRVLHHTWTQWYIEFIAEEYLPELEALIVEVASYLDEHQ